MISTAQVDPKFGQVTLMAHYAGSRQDALTYLGIVLLNVDLQEDRAHFLQFIDLRWQIERFTPEVVFLGCDLDLGEFGKHRFESTLGLTHSKGVTTLSRVVRLVPSELKFFLDVTSHLDEVKVLKRVHVEGPQPVPAACFTPPVYSCSPPDVQTTSAWRADRPGGQE